MKRPRLAAGNPAAAARGADIRKRPAGTLPPCKPPRRPVTASAPGPRASGDGLFLESRTESQFIGVDCYSFDLKAGDILGAALSGGAYRPELKEVLTSKAGEGVMDQARLLSAVHAASESM